MDAQLPTEIAGTEKTVVMAALREAVDAVVAMSGSDATASTESVLSQLVVLEGLINDIGEELEKHQLLLQVVKQRLMEM